MNESLAKQLHELVSNAKLHIQSEVDYQMDMLHTEINFIHKYFEEPKEQEKTNE